MNCYCIETNDKFIYCVENAENEYIQNIEHAWFKKEGVKYIKEYPNDINFNINDKELIKINFQKIGESMFKNEGNWGKSLEVFAEKCFSKNIEWNVIGSVSEAILGVEIIPHDIDIIIKENNFYETKDLFLEYLIEPFVDTNGRLVKYFGRLCIDGIKFDIVADNECYKYYDEYNYVYWKKYKTKMEPIKKRYEIEIQRNRIERIDKIKEYMIKNNVQ
jgi:hypothetical protein